MPQGDLVIPPFDLDATLTVPDRAIGLVLFAHGSGSSRLSPRNRQVAQALNAAGSGTLLFDLLTEAGSARICRGHEPRRAQAGSRQRNLPKTAPGDSRLKVWLESSITREDSNHDRRAGLWHLGAADRLVGSAQYLR